MKIKEVARSATMVWSPVPQASTMFALGTAAGAMDASFSVSGTVELFDLNLQTNDMETAIKGSVEAQDRFHRLAWGTHTAGEAYPYGILAGGLVDGSVQVWSPYHIATNASADIAKVKRHEGPVRGLAWNSYMPNLLASGAEDGEVFIWDFSNATAPAVFTPGPKNPQSVGAITCVAWNTQVDHILASSSAQGAAVVWDLKAKRSVIAFGDPTKRMQPSHVSWSPTEATKLVVASENDAYPALQMWDLRNARSPIVELFGHTAGILSCSWCPHDPTLLLSSGKDHTTMCWNTTTGEWLGEVTKGDNDIFDVQWSLKVPAVFSTASFDGKVGMHSMHAHSSPPAASGFDAYGQQRPVPAVPPPPAWLKRPCGATFGFGGRLVSFGSCHTGVQLTTVAEDQSLFERFMSLQGVMQGGDLQTFCAQRAQACASPEEAEAWAFMKVLLSENCRLELLKYLQLDQASMGPPPPARDAPPAVPAPPPAAAPPLPEPVVEVAPPPQEGTDPFANSTPSPFDNLGADPSPFGGGSSDFASLINSQTFPEPAYAVSASHEADSVVESLSSQLAFALAPAAPPRQVRTLAVDPIAGTPAGDMHVTRALIAGDLAAAVDASFNLGNLADALLIASIAGPGSDLEKSTIKRYLESQMDRSFMRVAMAVVEKDLGALLRGVNAENWKEVLALLCTYASTDEFTPHCNELAQRLESFQLVGPSVLCYMCSGNVDKVVAAWAASNSSIDDKAMLQSFVERTVVFLRAASNAQEAKTPGAAQPFFCRYAENLAAQGHLGAAMAYLGAQDGGSVAELRYRIYQAMPEAEKMQYQGPAFPFENKDLDLMVQETATYQAQAAAAAAEAERQAAAAAVQAQMHAQQMQQQMQMQQNGHHQMNGGYPQQGGGYPQQPAYGVQPQAPAYGVQPQAPAYGVQPQAPAYGVQPQAPAYGVQPQAPAVQPSWGGAAPAQHEWGAPAQPVAQQAPAYGGQSQAPAYGVQAAAPTSWSPAQPVARPVAPAPATSWTPGYVPTAPSGLRPAAPPVPAAAQVPAHAPVDPALLQQGESVKQGLTAILQRCQVAYGNNPGEQRKIADTEKKINVLFDGLGQGKVSAAVIGKLLELSAAGQQGDFQHSLGVYTALTREHFQEISAWGPALSRLLNMGKMIR